MLLLLNLALVSCQEVQYGQARQLKEKGVSFHLKRQWDSADFYYQQAIPLAKEEGDLETLARVYNNLGSINKALGKHELRLRYYEQALELYQSLGLRELEGETLMNIGQTHLATKEIDKSIDCLIRSTRILSEFSKNKIASNAYTSLGNAYTRISEFEKAIDSHNKAIEVGKKLNSKTLGTAFNNLGKAYMLSGQYEIARGYLKIALSYNDSVSNMASLAHAAYNLSKLDLYKKDYTASTYWLDSAKHIYQDLKDSIQLPYTSLRFADIAIKNEKPGLALSWIDSAKKQLSSTPQLSEQIALVSKAIEVNQALGNLRVAIILSDSLRTLDRALLNEERNERIANLEAIHKVNMLNATILEQENELLGEENNRNIAIASSLLLVAGVIIIWREKRRSDQKRRITEAQKQRIETLLREMHHRIKNNLSAFAGIMGLEIRRQQNQESKELLRESQNRLKAISKIHQKLYLSTEEALAKVDLKAYLEELCEEVMFNFNFRPDDLKLQLELEEVDLDTDRAILLGQLLNEALTNAFKYALCDHPDPVLLLRLEVKDQKIIVTLKDNGPGIPEKQQGMRKGIGSTLFKELSKQLHADWKLSNNNGAQHTWVLGIKKGSSKAA